MNYLVFFLTLFIRYSFQQDIQFPLSVEGHDLEAVSIADTITNLNFDIHRVVWKHSPSLRNSYFVYSPVSISTALYLLLLGANGKTYNELSKLLGISNNSDLLKPHKDFSSILRDLRSTDNASSVITIANGLFVENSFPISQQYKHNSQMLYKSELLNLDFHGNPAEAKDVINDWVFKKTLGKIENIISAPMSSDTELVIVSSLYFKSDWAIPFDSSLTKLQPFYPDGRNNPSKLKVNLMANSGLYRYYNDTNLNCEIVGLEYKDTNIVFYLVLPHNSNKEKVQKLEKHFTHADLRKLAGRTVIKQVIVAIPKMKLSSSYQLVNVLKELGLKSLFNPKESNLSLASRSGNIQESFVFPRMRDLSNATEERRKREVQNKHSIHRDASSETNENLLDSVRHSRDLYNPRLFVNEILHKVVVDVNEKGTEGSAATLVSTLRTSFAIIKANTPFLFFIQHEPTETILFWGSVITPTPIFE